MKVLITARGFYQVQEDGFSIGLFQSLVDANSYIRAHGEVPIYCWLN